MKLKRLLLIFTIFVVLIGINAASAMDSNNVLADDVGDSIVSSISNESIDSDGSILKINDDSQMLSQRNVIILDAEDNHNEMDDPTIQLAINNANANDTIIINGNSYVHCHFVVDKQLTIISNVSTSMTPCPSNTQGSGYRGIFYISPEASGTVIEGFTINNNMVSGENDYGVLIRGASDVIVRNCEIMSSASADAIRIENAENAIIENCTVNSLTNAIRIKNSQNTVVNNSVVKNSNIGVNLVESIQTVLTNNVITLNKVSGVYIDDKNSNTTICSNNITNNNGKGIDAASVNQLDILNNYIAFNKNGDSGAGIYINCNINGLVIKGNVLQENGNYAVLYDYRVRNIGPDGLGENVATVNYNYIFGHTDRAIYHITYNKVASGTFIYDAENDEYIAVGYGNGDYDVGMTTAYLGYSYLINEQLCPSIYFTWGELWSQGNYRLVLSDISQINKGTYAISVVDPNGDIAKDLNSIYVTFYLNKNDNKPTPQQGDVYKTVLIQNGTATASFNASNFNQKDNVLTVSFPGPNPTLTGNPFKRMDIPDSEIPGEIKQTTLTLTNLTTYPNSGEDVIANLKDDDGYELAGKNIILVLDSQRYVVRTDDNGNVKFNVSLAEEGTYGLTAIFEGDNVDYFGSEAQSTVIIRKIATNIESEDYYVVPGLKDYYSVTLNDESCNPVSSQKVTFNLDGKNHIITTDSNGQASLELLFDANNTDYKVTITFEGNEKYVGCSNSSFIYVRYSSKDAELTVPFIDSLPGEVIDYVVTLKGFDDEILEGEQLTIYIDGVEYKNKTDSNGQVTIRQQFNELGDYEVVALYNGSDIYRSVSNSTYIRVAKASTQFVAQNLTVLPYVEIQMPVSLRTYKDEALPNQEFNYEIDGMVYSNVTDGNGDSIISYAFSKEAIYPVKLTYDESDKYNGTILTVYVDVKRITSLIESYNKTFSKDSSQNFTVALTGENGDLIVNQEVIFTVNGNDVTKTTDSNGRAGINVASNVGSFDVVTSYAGNDKYGPVSKTNKITVLDDGKIVYVDCDLPNSEIQRILDSCDDGDVVKFLGDSYDNISLTVYRELKISPKNKTTLNAIESHPAFIILANNTSISDFDIVANSANGIDVSAANVKLEGNNITNKLDSSKSSDYYNSTISLPGYGINVSNSIDVEIVNNVVSLFESGIYAENTSNLIIDENYLKENNYGIKYGFGVSDSRIINNTIIESIGLYTMEVPEGPRGYGIFLNNSAVNVSIIGNVITWNHLGISIDSNGSTGIIVTSNLITDSVLEGIRFNAGYDLAKDAVEPLITDNAIYRNARGPSMMILGEMSANPAGIYGPGEWDDNAKLHIDANWYGVNALQTWNNETGIVGIGTMCPRIKTYEIKFDKIDVENPGYYSITFTKDGEIASNLCEFDLYATLNKGKESEQEVNFKVINGIGHFSFDLTKVDGDDYYVDISVGSLNSQERVFKSLFSSRIKVDPTFSVAHDYDASELIITLSSSVTGQPIRGANVAINLNGENSTAKTDYYGQVKVSTAHLTPDYYNVVLSYKGSSKFNPVIMNLTFSTKNDMVISAVYDGSNSEIVATLTNKATGKTVANANVEVDINGVTSAVKSNSRGKVTVSTGNYSSGTATISYAGNAKYNPASTSIDFAIKTDMVISAVYDEASYEIVAFLTNNATGKAVANANVVVDINGETTTVKSNSNGKVIVSTADLPLGTYAATISYAGNIKYNPASTTIDIAVKTKVIVTDVYGYSDRIVAKLTNGATGKAISNAYMVVAINGVNYTVKSNNKGQITLNTTDLKLPSSYDVTISYKGNSRYTPSSATTRIDLNKANMMITTKYHADKQKLVATLKNSITGKSVSNANMVIDLNGVKSIYKSDYQGKIILPTAEFSPGTYVGTVTYPGNARYNSISAVFKVDV